LAKNPLQIEHALEAGANQDMHTYMVDKEGKPTRQVGQQDKRANKTSGPKRQVGQSIDLLALTADIFIVATHRTDKTKLGKLARPMSLSGT
jgi:hypothetical protein